MASAPNAPLIIPDQTRTQFGDLVDLILGSESMNDEEKQYWINILPIMTPDQVENLRGILTNEREQLKAIDAKYASQVQSISNAELVKKTGTNRQAQRTSLQKKEQSSTEEEEEQLQQVLEEIENL